MENDKRIAIPYPERGEAWEDAREHIIKQILASERQYVQHLYHFIFEFRVQLAEAMKSGKIQPFPDVIEDLLRGIAPIYKLKFLPLLESSIVSKVCNSKFGEAFNSYVTLFKVYTEYSIGYQRGIETLINQFKVDQNLLPAVESFQSNVGVSLLELLRLPIERIPLYRLKLLELLRVTPREHADRASLVAAYIQITPMSDPFRNILLEQGARFLTDLAAKYPQLDLNTGKRFLMFHSEVRCLREKGDEPMSLWLFNDAVMVSLPHTNPATPVLFGVRNMKVQPVDVPAPFEHGVDFMTDVDSYRLVFETEKRLEFFCETVENIRTDHAIYDDCTISLAPVCPMLAGVADCALCGRAFGIATQRQLCSFCRRCCCKRCLAAVRCGEQGFLRCKECTAEGAEEARPHMLIAYNRTHVFTYQ